MLGSGNQSSSEAILESRSHLCLDIPEHQTGKTSVCICTSAIYVRLCPIHSSDRTRRRTPLRPLVHRDVEITSFQRWSTRRRRVAVIFSAGLHRRYHYPPRTLCRGLDVEKIEAADAEDRQELELCLDSVGDRGGIQYVRVAGTEDQPFEKDGGWFYG